MCACVCLEPQWGPLMGKRMALRQWRPTKGMEGKRKKRDGVSECVCECRGGGVGRQNLIRGKTNRGKDWVKEQEELRSRRGRERERKKKMQKQKIETWKREREKNSRALWKSRGQIRTAVQKHK